MTQTAPTPPGSLLSQLIATGGGEIANRVAQILSVSLAGWVLGVEGVAIIGVAWSLTAIALAVVQSGPELAGMAELARTDRPAAVASQVVTIKIGLAVLAVPILIAVQIGLGRDDRTAMVQLGVQTAAMALTALSHVWILRSLGHSVDQGATRLIQAIGGLVLLALALAVWRSPLTVPMAEGAAALLGLVWARHRLAGRKVRCGWLARPSRPFALSAIKLGAAGMLSSVMWLTPIIAAARWAGSADVSYLTGSMRLILGLNGLLQISVLALYPHLAHLFAHGTRGGEAAMGIAVQAALATAVMAGLCAFSADWSIPLLLGPEFQQAAPLFQNLVFALVPVAVGSPLTYALMANRRTSEVTVIQIAATIATVAGCAASFQLLPPTLAPLVIHPLLWLQTGATIVVAVRLGIITWPGRRAARMLAPGHVHRLLRGEG